METCITVSSSLTFLDEVLARLLPSSAPGLAVCLLLGVVNGGALRGTGPCRRGSYTGLTVMSLPSKPLPLALISAFAQAPAGGRLVRRSAGGRRAWSRVRLPLVLDCGMRGILGHMGPLGGPDLERGRGATRLTSSAKGLSDANGSSRGRGTAAAALGSRAAACSSPRAGKA